MYLDACEGERVQAWVEGGVNQRFSHDKDFGGSHGVLWTGMDPQNCPKLRTPTSIDKSGI